MQPGLALRDRYVLERPLGRGGMGEVWLAHDQRLRRPVAVKVLLTAIARDPTCSERFRREALAAAKVSHPNIVALFDVELDHEPPFMVLEYVDGITISHALRDGPLGVARSVAIAEGVLDALVALHARGILHRDIKPGNVMLSGAPPHELVRLLDLGVAELKTGTVYDRLTRTGAIIGTPSYMAPEVLEGRGASAASDLWAVGVLTFNALTHEKPFDGDLARLLETILSPTPAPDVRRFVPDIPPPVAALVAHLLAKSPDARPASAQAALDELRAARWTSGRAVGDTPASVVPTSIEPASVAPASVVPTSIGPTSIGPASVAPASVAPASVAAASSEWGAARSLASMPSAAPAPRVATTSAPSTSLVAPSVAPPPLDSAPRPPHAAPAPLPTTTSRVDAPGLGVGGARTAGPETPPARPLLSRALPFALLFGALLLVGSIAVVAVALSVARYAMVAGGAPISTPAPVGGVAPFVDVPSASGACDRFLRCCEDLFARRPAGVDCSSMLVHVPPSARESWCDQSREIYAATPEGRSLPSCHAR